MTLDNSEWVQTRANLRLVSFFPLPLRERARVRGQYETAPKYGWLSFLPLYPNAPACGRKEKITLENSE